MKSLKWNLALKYALIAAGAAAFLQLILCLALKISMDGYRLIFSYSGFVLFVIFLPLAHAEYKRKIARRLFPAEALGMGFIFLLFHYLFTQAMMYLFLVLFLVKKIQDYHFQAVPDSSFGSTYASETIYRSFGALSVAEIMYFLGLLFLVFAVEAIAGMFREKKVVTA